MKAKIYVSLLNEGVSTYKYILAERIRDTIYTISEDNDYDSEDEEWEFIPGTTVVVEMKKFQDGTSDLVAIKEYSKM
ncbi:hypothetical protein [Desulfovibrio litoralis]|uniref:Uncharacterized protein n=1 Tax=Desulfovibrio litoralis DSM 11393 TaxID=1121455 RepID=A0A1M7RS01_9BACT|nr:hypothetical protein [Desulfovibrio litoralis]SHN49004.1 hypothetical protein SAMN02745728_00085 [Desulfovibrio litoralis DSM 11393]